MSPEWIERRGVSTEEGTVKGEGITVLGVNSLVKYWISLTLILPFNELDPGFCPRELEMVVDFFIFRVPEEITVVWRGTFREVCDCSWTKVGLSGSTLVCPRGFVGSGSGRSP